MFGNASQKRLTVPEGADWAVVGTEAGWRMGSRAGMGLVSRVKYWGLCFRKTITGSKVVGG